MGRFLRALEKVGLVAVEGSAEDPENQGDTLAFSENDATGAADSTATQVSNDSLRNEAPIDMQMSEGRPFEEIYANIAQSPYPAEKMLKLVDGLKTMDASTRLAAVKAMDDADDGWTIDDPVADAKAKISALSSHASSLTAQVTAVEKETEAALASLDAENDKSVSAIRKQISELEALLARQIEKTATDKAAAQNRLQAAREACTRETGRLHMESARLSTLVEIFGTPKDR